MFVVLPHRASTKKGTVKGLTVLLKPEPHDFIGGVQIFTYEGKLILINS